MAYRISNGKELIRHWGCLLTLILVAPAFGDYVAYSVSKKGKSPLPENIDEIDAKYLVNLEWGGFDGRRSRVGVLEVDNRSTTGSFTISTGMGNIDFASSATGVPVNGIEAIVTDCMNRSGRFRLVERKILDSIIKEQDLASSGRIAKPSGAKTGNILGAEYLVQVVVTDYESNTKSTGGGVGGFLSKKVPLLGGVGLKRGEGHVGLNFRLVDAETSEVVHTMQIDSVIKEAGIILGGGGVVGDLGLGGFFGSYSRTPIGQAVIAGINEGVFDLIKQIGARPGEGTIIKADGNKIFLNMGSDVVSVGDRLEVKSKGEELIDPETGISLGSSDTSLGQIEVNQVQEKFSIARPVSLSGKASGGDLVVALKAPPSLEFAPGWKPPRKR